MPKHAVCSCVPPVLRGLWHVSRPPRHLFAILVQKPDNGLGECPISTVQRASALVKVNPVETVCCDTEVALGSVCSLSRASYVHDACMSFFIDLTVASAFPLGTLGMK